MALSSAIHLFDALVMAVGQALLLPVQYLVQGLLPRPPPAPAAQPHFSSVERLWEYGSSLPLLASCVMLAVALLIYLCEWIQRKIMAKRITKMKEHLSARLERLRALDERQEKVERTLQLVRGAADEYSLLLHLLQRRRRA